MRLLAEAAAINARHSAIQIRFEFSSFRTYCEIWGLYWTKSQNLQNSKDTIETTERTKFYGRFCCTTIANVPRKREAMETLKMEMCEVGVQTLK